MAQKRTCRKFIALSVNPFFGTLFLYIPKTYLSCDVRLVRVLNDIAVKSHWTRNFRQNKIKKFVHLPKFTIFIYIFGCRLLFLSLA